MSNGYDLTNDLTLSPAFSFFFVASLFPGIEFWAVSLPPLTLPDPSTSLRAGKGGEQKAGRISVASSGNDRNDHDGVLFAND